VSLKWRRHVRAGYTATSSNIYKFREEAKAVMGPITDTSGRLIAVPGRSGRERDPETR
jgi:hypothetical protein